MNRRALFAALAAGAVGFALDPERLLWSPGRKLISIPGPLPIMRDRWIVMHVQGMPYRVSDTLGGAPRFDNRYLLWTFESPDANHVVYRLGYEPLGRDYPITHRYSSGDFRDPGMPDVIPARLSSFEEIPLYLPSFWSSA